MRAFRFLACLLLFAAVPARAAEEPGDERFLWGALALVQQFVHLAAHSPDPQAAQKAIDGMLAGQNAEANRLASGLMDEVLLEVPPEHRAAVLSIGRDLLALARRERQRQGAVSGGGENERAIQARKDLHAMGLRYYDEEQYREAVKRGDTIAVELYRAARGLRDLPAAR